MNALLSEPYEPETDRLLTQAAVAGDRKAFETLVHRHQRFVYALCLRMLGSPADAAAQEILLRIVTNLGTFRGEAAFRTWAYRIAIRHLLAFRASLPEQRNPSFEGHRQALEATPDEALVDERALPADLRLVAEEVKVSCLMGLLLCLDREHRVAFVLSALLEASDVVCAELLGISRDNVRQRVCRAREQLRSFLDGRCGLVAPRNPCLGLRARP